MKKERAREAIDVFADHANDPDDVIVRGLVARGFSDREAEYLVTFLPLAFGRAHIARVDACAGLSLSPYADLDQSRRIELKDVPEFTVGLEIAEDYFQLDSITREAFMAVSMRGAEMQAVNRALNLGREMKGATMSPPYLLRLGEMKVKKNASRPNQALQTTSVTRRVFVRIVEFGRRLRGV